MQETQSYQRFQRIGHTDFNTSGTNGPRGEIGAFSPSATAVLCVASETHFISPCFYIHTFPGSLCPPLYQIRQSCRHNAVPNHFLSRFSTYLTNAPRSLSRVKVGTHSAFRERSHTTAHTPKQGPSGRGRYYYPRTVSHVSETLRGRVSERRTLPLWDLDRAVLSKNAESLRNSDALMRAAVPKASRPRWAA